MIKFIDFILNLIFKKQPIINNKPLKVMTLRVPESCIDLIAKFEGLKLEPYLDVIGVPTIGYGATYYKDGTMVTMRDKPISIQEAKDLLSYHVRSFYDQVKLITLSAKLNENQLSALTSFSYNLGIGALLKSTLLKKLKLDPLDVSIKDEFVRWNKAGGKELAGLTKRRKEEAELYFT